MDLGLTGKRALVGGGAAGIGQGIAAVLAAEGAQSRFSAGRVSGSRPRPSGSAGMRSSSTLPRRMDPQRPSRLRSRRWAA